MPPPKDTEKREIWRLKRVGRKQSEETRRKISEAHKGKSLSETHRAKIAAGNKGKVVSPETRARLSRINTGKRHTDETKKKLSDAGRGKKISEAHKKALHEGCRNAVRTPEWRAKVSASLTGRPVGSERIKKLSDGAKQWYANLSDQEREAHTARKVAAPLAKKERTSIERAVCSVLDALGIQYVQQKQIGPFYPDIYIEQFNLVIECDGTYWHNLPGAQSRDRMRDGWFKKHGYQVLRIPEIEIKANAEVAVSTRLAPYLSP